MKVGPSQLIPSVLRTVGGGIVTDEGPVRWVAKTAFVMPLLPPELGVNPLLAGLLHCMAFLELSGDDTVDPDWAVEAMEYVATYVQRLPAKEAAAAAQELAAVAEYSRTQGASTEFTAFIAGFAESCGIPKDDTA